MDDYKLKGRSKHERANNSMGVGWLAIPDTGYTSACPSCGDRFNPSPQLVGKTREVTIADCEKCSVSTKVPSRFARYNGLGGIGKGY